MYFAGLAIDFAIMTDNLVVSSELRGPISSSPPPPPPRVSVMFFGEVQISHIGASGIPHQGAKKCEHFGDNLKLSLHKRGLKKIHAINK